VPSRFFESKQTRNQSAFGNNVANPLFGNAREQLLRCCPEGVYGYADGLNTPAGPNRPSARLVSLKLFGAPRLDTASSRDLTDCHTFWGQTMDHDIDLSPFGPDPADTADIKVDFVDPVFNPNGDAGITIPCPRSLFNASTGGTTGIPREQLTVVTAFLDQSITYGSDEAREAGVRLFKDGLLNTTAGGLFPPFNDKDPKFGNGNAGPLPGNELYLTGDVRANENPWMFTMHVLFVREHNNLARRFKKENPQLVDEELYQLARRWNIAFMQAISENEYAAILLGEDPVNPYQGYNPLVNPGINQVFSVAAFRYGHSEVNPFAIRLDEDGKEIKQGHIPLQQSFFDPRFVVEDDIDSMFRGMAKQRQQEVDATVVEDMRDVLYAPTRDIVSRNIQRGREHGLPDYNTVRTGFNLARLDNISSITTDVQYTEILEELYQGDINDVDLYVGGITEFPKHANSNFGPLFHAIVKDQYTRIRDGDRFWYDQSSMFTVDEIAEIKSTKLSTLILRNTQIAKIQCDVMIFGSANICFGTPDVEPTVDSSASTIATSVFALFLAFAALLL
jgi:peroxidase